MFDCGRPAYAAQFDRAPKATINIVRMTGEKEAMLIANAVEAMIGPTIPQPPRPPQIPQEPVANPPVMIEDEARIIMWQGDLKTLLGRRRDLAERSNQTYPIIWDQCSPTTKGKLEQMTVYAPMNAAKNPVQLLQDIKNISCGREAHKQPIYSMAQLVKMMTCLVQGQNESNEDYNEALESLWDTLDQQGESLVHHPGLINDRAIKIAINNG